MFTAATIFSPSFVNKICMEKRGVLSVAVGRGIAPLLSHSLSLSLGRGKGGGHFNARDEGAKLLFLNTGGIAPHPPTARERKMHYTTPLRHYACKPPRRHSDCHEWNTHPFFSCTPIFCTVFLPQEKLKKTKQKIAYTYIHNKHNKHIIMVMKKKGLVEYNSSLLFSRVFRRTFESVLKIFHSWSNSWNFFLCIINVDARFSLYSLQLAFLRVWERERERLRLYKYV